MLLSHGCKALSSPSCSAAHTQRSCHCCGVHLRSAAAGSNSPHAVVSTHAGASDVCSVSRHQLSGCAQHRPLGHSRCARAHAPLCRALSQHPALQCVDRALHESSFSLPHGRAGSHCARCALHGWSIPTSMYTRSLCPAKCCTHCECRPSMLQENVLTRPIYNITRLTDCLELLPPGNIRAPWHPSIFASRYYKVGPVCVLGEFGSLHAKV